ncbi:MAG: hypothetical protein FWD79_11640 [Desulfobulbus sp.]|nr:hypothetical protein [Desulfobulbus sp.]
MELQNVVKSVAPWLGTALGGPLAGMAVGWAAEKLGLSEKNADALQQALLGTSPENLLKLKQADQDFAAKMQELGFKSAVDLEELTVEDRKDARAMQIATRSRMPAIISTVVIVGFFLIFYGMLSKWFDVNESPGVMAVLNMMFGALIGSVSGVQNYWLGSTSNSAVKTELLARRE